MKRTLHDLIKTTPWVKIEEQLLEEYPTEDTIFYKHLFWKLHNITPIIPNTDEEIITLHLQFFQEENGETVIPEGEEEYYEADGPNEISDQVWAIYLGFFISEDSLNEVKPETLLAHMMFEFLYGDIENFIM